MKRYSLLIILLLGLVFTSNVLAEDVVLKNGRSFVAPINAYDSKSITVDIAGVSITYSLDEVGVIDHKTPKEFLAEKALSSREGVYAAFHKGINFAALGKLEEAWDYLSKGNLKNTYTYDFKRLLQVLELRKDTAKQLGIVTFFKGLQYYNSGFDYEKSAKEFKRAIKQGAEISPAYFYLGKAYFYLKNYPKALISLDKAKELVNNDAEVYFYIGQVYFDQEEYKQAIYNFSKASDYNASFEKAYIMVGAGYIKLKKPTHSLIYLENAFRINRNNPQTYFQFGLAYKALGDHQRALTNFSKAKEIYRVQGNSLMTDTVDSHLADLLLQAR